MMNRLAKATLFCLSLGLATGCMGAMMTPQVIQDSGTHTFNAPYEKVFPATVSALKSEGFPIAMSEQEKGLIKTGQKLVRTVAAGSSSYATAVEVTRQYVVHVSRSGDAAIVSAEPRIYQGTTELSDRPVWDLDSPAGERALWNRLFRDVQEAL